MQRIVAGRLRGRKLLALPPSVTARPTGARVREAIFSRLFERVRGARVLDLFAGSGAMAFESLSRGAAEAVVVDRDPAVVRHLRAQAAAFGLGEEIVVRESDALRYLEGPAVARFDLVFVDPPYADTEVLARVLDALVGGAWLASTAEVIVERARIRGSAAPIELPAGLRSDALREYGQTCVEFLRLAAPSR